MATAYMMNNLLVSCLMFFVMIGSLNAKPPDIKAICGKAKNTFFCTNYTKSITKTSAADIKTFATTILGSAQITAITGVTRYENLAKRPYPALEKEATACARLYKNTITSLGEATKSSRSGDGPGLKNKVSAAMLGPTRCQDRVAKFKADPSIPKLFKPTIYYKDDFEDFCDIVLVISDMM
ncbi:Pectinesterase inhibitor 2 [Raphanus sativus]|uniref:Pectinesterase inhibitor 2-like n=1 Tax=Raphanus sativus TaxID=3726 RepID=A0A6J0JHN5_RAPSA|nr:pectinesterase inhibitor 2-like [Raphanus sativus]XP_056853054.1 pectinesterase inhibitor 2-like [Raphanus sativus]KAJ4871975.1 Pectinesterase inhibitor 2 [Raphanus sativus]KAJ4886794.1 Pectinesterase inhibitor 2 [Raphanus sativus]